MPLFSVGILRISLSFRVSHSTSLRVSITQRSIILLENNVSAVSHHSERLTQGLSLRIPHSSFSLIFSHSERLFSPSLIQRASSESHSHKASFRVPLFSEFICSQSISLRVSHSESVTPKASHSECSIQSAPSAFSLRVLRVSLRISIILKKAPIRIMPHYQKESPIYNSKHDSQKAHLELSSKSLAQSASI